MGWKCSQCGLEYEVVDVIFDDDVVSVQCYCTDCKEMVFLCKLLCDLNEEDYEWFGGCE